MKYIRRILLPFVFAAVMALGTTNANAACKVILGDFDWSSANVHTAISDFIYKHGYGCDVEVKKGSTSPIMAALYDQQIDLITEVWRDNIVQQFEEQLAKGTIVEHGINTPASIQAFYVDEPTAKKYNLKSVEDMKDAKIAALFKDPEQPDKGRMTSCISGWTCYTINLVKHKEYGLDEYYTNFDPGSSGALDAAIAGGFKKGKPVFTYYWEPTGLMAKVDLRRLEEPAYGDGKCWEDMMKVVEDIKADGPEAYKKVCASEYKDMALTKASTKSWAEANPELVKFIKAYSLPTATVNSLLLYYEDETQGDMEATARHFLSTSDVWIKWVPADVAKKVKAAL
jgi:glycine betaine/proline transport system substrate-binding protein|tara:strand:- start:879 stop:1901 length:1023 start_codon:yes stop_codon:yes gene_type:complete